MSIAETYKKVMKSVGSSLEAVAASLEHHGGTLLTDSLFHHCWSFPPEQDDCLTPAAAAGDREKMKLVEEEEEEDDDEVTEMEEISEEETCGCGVLKLSDLPSNCKWNVLGNNEGCSFVPDSIRHYLKRATGSCASAREKKERDTEIAGVPQTSSHLFPLVCDPFLPKLRAVETASDLASTILRTSMCITDVC